MNAVRTEPSKGEKMEPSVAKKLWHIVRVAYYMLRKGLSKRKLMMDLQLLLKRGKMAREALGNLMTFHHHHHHTGDSGAAHHSAFSRWYMDPDLSFYNQKGVEFSCSSTPSYPSFHLTKRKHSHHRGRRHDYYNYDVTMIAKAFEMLNDASDAESVVASPSPAVPAWSFGKSPAFVRQLRITDSPFPIAEEEGEEDGRVDQEAAEFIERFYDQLRRQQLHQSATATPEYRHRRTPLAFRA